MFSIISLVFSIICGKFFCSVIFLFFFCLQKIRFKQESFARRLFALAERYLAPETAQKHRQARRTSPTACLCMVLIVDDIPALCFVACSERRRDRTKCPDCLFYSGFMLV